MKITACVSNTPSGHTVEVKTEGRKQSIAIPAKSVERGSSVNGGELLFSFATIFTGRRRRAASRFAASRLM
jgi:hypothetical protein